MMPRARNIKPAFFKNELLVELPIEARLLFIGLWTLADREGRLENRPKRIKMEIYPADDYDIAELLLSLQNKGFIYIYGEYIQVINFTKHQSPHVKEAASIIPAPDEHHASTVLAPCKHPLNPESLILNPESPILKPEVTKVTKENIDVADLYTALAEKKKPVRASVPEIELPYTTLPDEWKDFCKLEMKWDKEQAYSAFTNFRDYWTSPARGAKNKKKDWFMTFKTTSRSGITKPNANIVPKKKHEREDGMALIMENLYGTR